MARPLGGSGECPKGLLYDWFGCNLNSMGVFPLMNLAEKLIRAIDNGHDSPVGHGRIGGHTQSPHLDGMMLSITVVDEGVSAVVLASAFVVLVGHLNLPLSKVLMGTVGVVRLEESFPLGMLGWKLFSGSPFEDLVHDEESKVRYHQPGIVRLVMKAHMDV